MKLHRPALTALVLFLGVPTLGAADAEAAIIRRAKIEEVVNTHGPGGAWDFRLPTTVGGDAVATVTATLSSDGGEEELPLVETDAWLHGAGTIAALPAADAPLTVTLYDAGSASLISFSGTLGADGAVTLSADDTRSTDSEECASRTGCVEDTSREETLDIELLAAELFATDTGYELGIDLAGADTYAVAYATITVTEPGEPVCVAGDEKGNCLKWGGAEEVSTRSEVDWDDLGSVWEADATLAHEGVIELTLKARDAEGNKLEMAKSKLGMPWSDGGEGIASLATDEDPLTYLAFGSGLDWTYSRVGRIRRTTGYLTVVSQGWGLGDTLPTHAEVELTDGETLTIPVNSYQRKKDWEFSNGGVEHADEWEVRGRIVVSDPGSGEAILDVAVADLGGKKVGLCCADVCLVDTGTGAWSLTAYGDDADALPDVLVVAAALDGELLEEAELTLDDEITTVFAYAVDVAGDPVGLGLSGKVKLLGEPNGEGKQETLAKGKFYGTFSRDGDGDLELAGTDADSIESSGDVIAGVEAVFLTDREGEPQAPPAIQYGNGSGTKNAASQVSAKPELL